MSVSELLRWQWEGYSRYHRSRVNLLVHLGAVPLFLLSNITLLVALIQRSWFVAAVALVATVGSVALQGIGHGQEPVPPEPFEGPLNAVSRIFFEQWVTFPRFVLSGDWLNALRQASAP
jgi:uncharacterized membrane protein YGL010W